MRLQMDATQWHHALSELGEKNAHKAGARAINRTLSNARTASVRVVAKDMALKQAHVRERITPVKATEKKPIGYLYATTKRTPLMLFKAKEAGKGRGVRAKLPGSAGKYPHAFIRTMRSGHEGVFERKGRARLPIRELKGPSVAQSFTRNSEEPTARAVEMLAKNMAHEVQYLISKSMK
jgi:hypothetical protein